MIRAVLAVFGKELVDHGRDRRSVISALMFPIFGPILFTLTMHVLAGWADTGQAVKLAVVGHERAPNLMLFLRRYGVEPVQAPKDYEARVQDGTLDAVLVVSDEYPERWREGLPAEVQLLSDSSQRASGTRVQKLRQILEVYSGFIATDRLLARGVSPELARALEVNDIDLATPEKLAAMLLNMIPILLVLAAFVGGMNVAIDATAGERERGSLEPLLTNPVPRGAITAGKWLTTVVMASLSVGVTMLGFAFAVSRIPLQDLGVKATLGVPQVLAILAAVLPLTLLASSLQMLVATYARSFKEAQTYLSLLLFLPTLPGMLLAFTPFEPTALMSLIPVLGQHVLVDKVIAGAGMDPSRWALSVLGLLPLTALCLWGCTRLLQRERIVFGR